MYDNEIVGGFIADIIVDNTIILEVKTVRRIVSTHKVQMVNYLVATGKPVSSIIDFGKLKVEITCSAGACAA